MTFIFFWLNKDYLYSSDIIMKGNYLSWIPWKDSIDKSFELIDRAKSIGTISKTKARLLKVLTVLWTNPIINYKPKANMQVWLVNISRNVRDFQIWVFYNKAKNVDAQAQILWYQQAKNVWTQFQIAWYQECEKADVQLHWVWLTKARKVGIQMQWFWWQIAKKAKLQIQWIWRTKARKVEGQIQFKGVQTVLDKAKLQMQLFWYAQIAKNVTNQFQLVNIWLWQFAIKSDIQEQIIWPYFSQISLIWWEQEQWLWVGLQYSKKWKNQKSLASLQIADKVASQKTYIWYQYAKSSKEQKIILLEQFKAFLSELNKKIKEKFTKNTDKS